MSDLSAKIKEYVESAYLICDGTREQRDVVLTQINHMGMINPMRSSVPTGSHLFQARVTTSDRRNGLLAAFSKIKPELTEDDERAWQVILADQNQAAVAQEMLSDLEGRQVIESIAPHMTNEGFSVEAYNRMLPHVDISTTDIAGDVARA